MTTLDGIARERFGYGDPVDVILRDAVGYGGHWLHRVVYDNGKCEFIQDRDLHQCSANAGGDPASGCDTIINPYATDGLCSKHRAAARTLHAGMVDASPGGRWQAACVCGWASPESARVAGVRRSLTAHMQSVRA